MFRSLRSRLFASHLIVSTLVLIFVAFGIVLLVANSQAIERQTLVRLESVADLIAERGPRAVQLLASDRINSAFQNLGLAGSRGLVIGRNDEVLADTQPALALPPADVRRHSASGTSGSYGGLLNRWLYVARPIGDGRSLLLLARRPSLMVAVGRELLLPLILRAGLIAVAASLLLAWLVSRWVATPLQRTAQAARAVAAGDYEQRLETAGPDEAHSLARSFNEMVVRVQSSQLAMRDFVANVSHELRTPLTSIQGFAQALQDGTAEDPKRAAQVIQEEAGRLGRLVEELLELARIDSGQASLKRGPVEIGIVLGSIHERLQLRAEKRGVRLANHSGPELTIIGDGDRLAQVFTNLIDNAIKHTDQGGEVRLRWEADPAWVTVHVEDSGSGIPPEELPRIFERFYRLDKARAGSGPRGAGLGLAISKEIVEAHGGELTAKSVPGRGSRFSVRLPIVQPGDETLARSKV